MGRTIGYPKVSNRFEVNNRRLHCGGVLQTGTVFVLARRRANSEFVSAGMHSNTKLYITHLVLRRLKTRLVAPSPPSTLPPPPFPLVPSHAPAILTIRHYASFNSIAHPQMKEFPHLIGNYGGPWQLQKMEFATFPGPVLVTTNCLLEPKPSYQERIYSANAAG